MMIDLRNHKSLYKIKMMLKNWAWSMKTSWPWPS